MSPNQMQLFTFQQQQQLSLATNNAAEMMMLNNNNMLNATIMLPGNNNNHNNNFMQKYTTPSPPHQMGGGFNNISPPPVLSRMHQHIPLHHQSNFNHNHQRTRRRRSNHSLVASMDPEAVARRNERERNRVKQVNDGFDALRKKVPFLPDKKKLSKVEILRCAMMYIRDLKGVVEEFDHNNTHFAPLSFGIKTRPDGSLSSSTSDDDLLQLDQDFNDDLLTQ